MVFFIVSLIVLFTLLLCGLMTWQQYRGFILQYGKLYRCTFTASIWLWVFDHFRLQIKLPVLFAKIRNKLVVLHMISNADSLPATKMFIANTCNISCFIAIFFTLLAGVDRSNVTIWGCGLLISALIPVLWVKRLDTQLVRMRRQMALALPEFLDKVTLLVNAGETVQQAMIRFAETLDPHTNHPLERELVRLRQALSNQYSFAKCLDEFSRRSGVPEISVFVTTVLLNYKRGGEDFVIALRELSHELWEKRKALTRTLGEEASSKMVFPMIVIFIILMVMVAYPAKILMNS